jgi:hypothetical protein
MHAFTLFKPVLHLFLIKFELQNFVLGGCLHRGHFKAASFWLNKNNPALLLYCI